MGLLNIKQVAELKSVTKQAIYGAMRRGILKPYEHLTREALIVFEEDEVQKYLTTRPGRPKRNGHKP